MSILDKILAAKVIEVSARKREHPMAQVLSEAGAASACRDFSSALRRAADQPIRVIAEYKRASPSAGAIRTDLEVEDVARSYAAAGAAAMSILTDEEFFSGHLDYLQRARQVVDVPLLRKDFIIDDYQVAEARAAGADAVLLIVAALDDSQLRDLLQASHELGLGALVEAHSEAEAERAVAADATVIGVNHRDLRTFEIDLGLTARLRGWVPASTVLVAESGIRGPEDCVRLARDGADAVLVGEYLMRARDPGAALRELLAGAVPCT